MTPAPTPTPVPNWGDDAASDCSQAASSASRASMPFTVISSDDSQASIFDLRGRIHSTDGEWSEGEESLVSSDNEDEQAAAERETVANWRLFQDLQDDKDFAFVYVNFAEAYADAGRAVAMAWARCRQRSELTLETDAVHVSRISANVESMKAIDDIKKRKKVAAKSGSKPLRHPGQGTQKAELDSDKQRFFQPLVDIMKEGEAFRSENYNASDKEYTEALERRARRLCNDAEVPTLHRAVTTADDLRKWMEERKDGTNFINVQAVVLEVFIWQSNAKTRVVTALGWLCKHLGFDWPMNQIEKPKIGRGSSALGMETKADPSSAASHGQPFGDGYETGGGSRLGRPHLASTFGVLASDRWLPTPRPHHHAEPASGEICGLDPFLLQEGQAEAQ